MLIGIGAKIGATIGANSDQTWTFQFVIQMDALSKNRHVNECLVGMGL